MDKNERLKEVRGHDEDVCWIMFEAGDFVDLPAPWDRDETLRFTVAVSGIYLVSPFGIALVHRDAHTTNARRD